MKKPTLSYIYQLPLLEMALAITVTILKYTRLIKYLCRYSFMESLKQLATVAIRTRAQRGVILQINLQSQINAMFQTGMLTASSVQHY